MLEYTCIYAAVPFMLHSFHLSNRTVHVFPSKIKPLHSSQKNPHHNLSKAGSFSGIARLCYRSFWPFWPKERRLGLFPSRCILGSREYIKILFLKISCNSITTEALPGPKKEDHLLEPFSFCCMALPRSSPRFHQDGSSLFLAQRKKSLLLLLLFPKDLGTSRASSTDCVNSITILGTLSTRKSSSKDVQLPLENPPRPNSL